MTENTMVSTALLHKTMKSNPKKKKKELNWSAAGIATQKTTGNHGIFAVAQNASNFFVFYKYCTVLM